MDLEISERDKCEIPEQDLSPEDFQKISSKYEKQLTIRSKKVTNASYYEIISKDYIGHFPLNDRYLLKISPKVPIQNIFRMLEYAYNLPSFQLFEGLTPIASIQDIFERLVVILSQRVLDRCRKGLYFAYVRKEEKIPYIRGQVQLLPTIQAISHGSMYTTNKYNEYTPDNTDNQILAWTLYQLSRYPLQRNDARNLAHKAYLELAHKITTKPFSVKDCINRQYQRLNQDYQPLHSLCRFFLERTGPKLGSGDHDFAPFTLYMPNLFEIFVAEWIKTHLPNNYQLRPHHLASFDPNGHFPINIDLTIRDIKKDKIVAVVDTKYKKPKKPSRDDIAQMLSYAITMDTANAFLIYPSPLEGPQLDFTSPNKLIRVKSLTFDIGKKPEDAGNIFLEELLRLIG